MAVAPLRAGLVLASSDFDVYVASRQGERPDARALAARFLARCKAHGANPPADYANKVERLISLWSNIGLIEPVAPSG
jgi:hypothetical protein